MTAKDDAGASVGPATSQLSSSVAALKVFITLAPATIEQDEDKDGPKPIDVTATTRITNVTDTAVSQVNLWSLTTTPAKAGQIIKITQKTGPRPDPITVSRFRPSPRARPGPDRRKIHRHR